jgi:WD40 repeat protein
MSVPSDIFAELGKSTAVKPAEGIFNVLDQVSQAITILQTQNAELEHLRNLSVIHLMQFKDDYEIMVESYRRLRALSQQDQPPPANPFVSSDFKFRFTAHLSSEMRPDSLRLRCSLFTNSVVCSIQFAPDGSMFAFADRKFVYVNSESGDLIRKIDMPPGGVELPPRCLRFSTRGSVLAVCAASNAIALFVVDTGRLAASLVGHEASITSLLFSGDSQLLYSGGFDGRMICWDLSTFRAIRQRRFGAADGEEDASHVIVSLCFIHSGRILLTAFMGGIVQFEDLVTCARPRTCELEHKGLVLGCRALPDQIRFASMSQDMTVKIWEISDELCCIATLAGHGDLVVSICFSPDQCYAFSGSRDETLRVWGVGRSSKGLATVSGYSNTVFEIDHHPTKRSFINCSGEGRICLWDYAVT